MFRAEWEKLGKKRFLCLLFLSLLLSCWLLSEYLFLSPREKSLRDGSGKDETIDSRYSQLREQWKKREEQARAKGSSILYKTTPFEIIRLNEEANAYRTLLENERDLQPNYRWETLLVSPFPFMLQIVTAVFLCERLFLRERRNGYFSLVRSCAYHPFRHFGLRLLLFLSLFLSLSFLVYLLHILMEIALRGPLNNVPAQSLPVLINLDRSLCISGLFSLLFWGRYLASIGFALSFTFLSLFARNFLWSAFLLFLSISSSFALQRSISLNSRYLFWRFFNPAWIFLFFSELSQNTRFAWQGGVVLSENLALGFWVMVDLLLLLGIFMFYERESFGEGRYYLLVSRSRKAGFITRKKRMRKTCLAGTKRPRLCEWRRVMLSEPALFFFLILLAVLAFRTFSYQHIPSPQEKRLEALYAEYGGYLAGEKKVTLERVDQQYKAKNDEIEALRAEIQSVGALEKKDALYRQIETLLQQSLPSKDFYPILEQYRKLKERGGNYLLYERPYQLLLGLGSSSLQAQDYLIYSTALLLFLVVVFAPDFEGSQLEMYRCLSGGRDKLIREKLRLIAMITAVLQLLFFASRFYKLHRVFPLSSLAPILINISPNLVLPVSAGAAYFLQALFSFLICYCFSLGILLTFFQGNRMMSLAIGFILMIFPFLLYRLGTASFSLFSLLCGTALEYPIPALIQVIFLLVITLFLRRRIIISWREGGVKLLNKNA